MVPKLDKGLGIEDGTGDLGADVDFLEESPWLRRGSRLVRKKFSALLMSTVARARLELAT